MTMPDKLEVLRKILDDYGFPPAASDFIISLYRLADIIDDIEDGDNPNLDTKDLPRLLFSKCLTNNFYLANSATLLPVIKSMYRTWQFATDVEKSEDRWASNWLDTTYELKNCCFLLAPIIAEMVFWPNQDAEMEKKLEAFNREWIIMTRNYESLEYYKEKVTAKSRPDKK